jgi:1-acyl-sn-glycerol-3-phosphate acyltransferase
MIQSLRHIVGDGKYIDKAKTKGMTSSEQKLIAVAENKWTDKLLKHFKIDVIVEGQENIPKGPILVVANHQSYADIPVIIRAMNGKQIGFIARDNLGNIPLFGKWILRIRSLLLHRDDPRSAVKTFKDGEIMLREGFSLAVFPEGTRHQDGVMGEFKKGSLRVARQAGVPILPVTIHNSYKAFEAQGYIKPTTIRVCIHPQMITAKKTKDEVSLIREQVEQEIHDTLEEYNQAYPDR